MSDDQPETPAPDDAITKPPKKKRLTRKQAALARARVKEPEATLSEIGARAAYAGGPGTVLRELKKAHVQDRIRALMEAHPDTSMQGLHKKLVEGLNATKVDRHVFLKKTDVFNHDTQEVEETESLVVHEKVDVDYATRHRYLDTASDWVGLGEKRVRIAGDEDAPLPLLKALEILRAAQALGLTDGEAS